MTEMTHIQIAICTHALTPPPHLEKSYWPAKLAYQLTGLTPFQMPKWPDTIPWWMKPTKLTPTGSGNC